jgi:hypothetical protein
VRRNDILYRRKKKIEDAERDTKAAIDKRSQKLTDELQEAKNLAVNPENPDDPIEFNEEEWMEKWLVENPEIIPIEAIFDIDNDFDISDLINDNVSG